MKLKFSLVILSLATANFALAQATAPAAAPAAPTAAPVAAAPSPVQAAGQTVTVTTISSPTATIAPQSNNATAGSEIVKQPTTVVEAAPLTNSRADEMRKAREATEVETEQKIVEKLEQSRIEDEKRRQAKVIGSLSAAAAVEEKKEEKKSEVPPQAPIVVVQPQVQPAPAPVAAAPAAGTSKEEVQGLIKDELEKANKKEEKKYFMSAGLGTTNYNNSSDVRNFGSMNVSFGAIMPTGFALQGDFGYNSLNQDMTDYWGNYTGLYRSVDQYNLGVTGRFFFMSGKIRPSVGGTLDYVRRQYSGLQGTLGYGGFNNLDKMTSNALDAGAVGAVDVSVSDNVTLAFEYRYMMNLTYKYDSQSYLNTAAYSNSGAPALLESRNYQTAMLVLRYTY